MDSFYSLCKSTWGRGPTRGLHEESSSGRSARHSVHQLKSSTVARSEEYESFGSAVRELPAAG